MTSCCNVKSRYATLCSKDRTSNKYKKQILQESLFRSSLVIIFTHFETPSLLMVFTLIVSLSVLMPVSKVVIYIYLNNHLQVKVRWDFNKKSTPSPIYFKKKSTTRLFSQRDLSQIFR